MNTDLKIAQAAVLEPIDKIAHKAGIPEEYLEMYGKEKAKVNIKLMETLADKPDGKLVLVTRIAHGLPSGGMLDYADEMTLAHALADRRKMK